jgi:hypothetical protein
MVIIGALLLVMFLSSSLVLSAFVVAGQRNRQFEMSDGLTVEMSSQWSGMTHGGNYTTSIPHCSFEPEDLEDVQAIHHF